MGINRKGFASDNNAGVHPDILREISSSNAGHVIGYGSDHYTADAEALFRDQFGEDAEVYFVFTGTAANVLGLSSILHSWNSVITAFSAHIEQDECGAPEKFTGCKVLTVDTPDGKITPEMLTKHIHGFGFEHHSQPRVISITQTTEMGTVYTPQEIRSLASFAHNKGMLLHMDGARIANASVSLDLPFREFTTDAGVDVLSFGGTKNGMMYGEAVCFLQPGLSDGFKYIRKQGMQLASKMRYISAQYLAYFRNDLWRRNAEHANRMAQILAEKINGLPGIKITQAVQSNGVFVIMPSEIAETVSKTYFFYPWNELISEYRLMTSWDTTLEDIDEFVRLLKSELK
jgi:threonine aldolase